MQIGAGLNSGGAKPSLVGWGVKWFPRGKEKGPWQCPFKIGRGNKGLLDKPGAWPEARRKLAYTKGSQEKHGTAAQPEMGIPDKPKHSPAPPTAGSWPTFVASGAPSTMAGEY